MRVPVGRLLTQVLPALCALHRVPGVSRVDPIPPFGVSLATHLTRYMIFALVNQL